MHIKAESIIHYAVENLTKRPLSCMFFFFFFFRISILCKDRVSALPTTLKVLILYNQPSQTSLTTVPAQVNPQVAGPREPHATECTAIHLLSCVYVLVLLKVA